MFEKKPIFHLSLNDTLKYNVTGDIPAAMKGVQFLNENKGVKFSSFGSFLDFPYLTSFDLPKFTFETWIKPLEPTWIDENSKDKIAPNQSNHDNSGYVIIHQDAEDLDYTQFHAFMLRWSGDSKKFLLSYQTENTNEYLYSQSKFNEGAIYQVVVTKGSGGFKLYVNGDFQGEKKDAILKRIKTELWTIGSVVPRVRGNNNYFSRTWPGEIYSVKFYDHALIPEEVTALYKEYQPNIWKDTYNLKEAVSEINSLQQQKQQYQQQIQQLQRQNQQNQQLILENENLKQNNIALQNSNTALSTELIELKSGKEQREAQERMNIYQLNGIRSKLIRPVNLISSRYGFFDCSDSEELAPLTLTFK